MGGVPRNCRKVVIRLEGMDAYVAAPDAHLVVPLLADRVTSFGASARGIVGRRQIFQLGRGQDNGDVAFPAKLANHVAFKLFERGHEPALAFPNWPKLTQADESIIARLSMQASRLFSLPLSRCGTLMRFKGDAHPFQVVPDILRAYPRSRAVVAVPSRNQVRGWMQKLSCVGLDQRVVTSKSWQPAGLRPDPLVMVTTLHGLDHCTPHHFDLAIVPDAQVLRGVAGRTPDLDDPHPPRDYRFLRHWHIPAFGFMPANCRISCSEERRLQSFFSQVVELGGPPISRVGVCSVWLPMSSAQTSATSEPQQIKKDIWENARRNRFIAHLASKIHAAEPDTQQKLGLTFISSTFHNVVVLVESPSHAKHVAAELPNWKVMRKGETLAEAPNVGGNMIVTEAWAYEQSAIDADVMIDARGWLPLTIRSFPPPGQDRNVMLIDIFTETDLDAANRTSLRLREYRRRGWPVMRVTEPPSLLRTSSSAQD